MNNFTSTQFRFVFESHREPCGSNSFKILDNCKIIFLNLSNALRTVLSKLIFPFESLFPKKRCEMEMNIPNRTDVELDTLSVAEEFFF